MADQQFNSFDGRWGRGVNPNGVEDLKTLDPKDDLAVSERLRELLNGAWLARPYRVIVFDTDKNCWVRYDKA